METGFHIAGTKGAAIYCHTLFNAPSAGFYGHKHEIYILYPKLYEGLCNRRGRGLFSALQRQAALAIRVKDLQEFSRSDRTGFDRKGGAHQKRENPYLSTDRKIAERGDAGLGPASPDKLVFQGKYLEQTELK